MKMIEKTAFAINFQKIRKIKKYKTVCNFQNNDVILD